MKLLQIGISLGRIGIGALTGNTAQGSIVVAKGIEYFSKHLTIVVYIVGNRLLRQRRTLLESHIYEFEITYILRKNYILRP